MTKVTHVIMGRAIIVPETERAIVLRNGKIADIVEPGRHVLRFVSGTLEVEALSVNFALPRNALTDALLTTHKALANEHIVQFETAPDEIGLVFRDKMLISVMRPEMRTAFFKAKGEMRMETRSIADIADIAVEAKLAKRILSVDSDVLKLFKVEHGQTGLLFIDGALFDSLTPGSHAFIGHGRVITMKIVDMRETALDVVGQEVLTKDRVSVRVNLTATFRVVDAVKAVTEVKDFVDSLHRALGTAFRKSLAERTLDAVLEKKGRVDDEAAKEVKAIMAKAGVDVSAITLKDIILPGEMREILNTVVLAEKEAEANVIRRREETAATRALLNTAKVMADNPAMLRLKELEALENVAGKIGHLTVHSGTKGLLDEIVTLKG